MTICHDKKLIFIHIPKNAGTSVFDAMGALKEGKRPNDAFIGEYKMLYKEYWNNYTKFAIIRDPIDRFISSYKFAQMEESGWFSSKNTDGYEKHPWYDICSKLEINEYVSWLRETNQFGLLPQSLFLNDENGNISKEIDYIARFENITEDLKVIGLEIKKLNSSSIKDKNRIKLTDKSLRILYDLYKIDYDNFHFKKKNLLFQYK